jgi:hypothetical protein
MTPVGVFYKRAHEQTTGRFAEEKEDFGFAEGS